MRQHFEDFYAERQQSIGPDMFASIDTDAGTTPYVGASTKTPQEYGQDPILRGDYKLIVDTLKQLQHPRVQRKLYDWIKATFIKTPKGGSSATAMPDTEPEMYRSQDVVAPKGKPFSLSTASTPKQLSSFKGQTTKLAKKKR